MEFIRLMISINMKGIGVKIRNLVLEKSIMMMIVNILGISIKTLNRVWEYIFGMTEANMKECLNKIILMELVN